MSLPFTPRDAFSVMGAKHALGIPKSGSDEQRPVEFYSRQEVADAELASRARWARRGSTRQERITSVKDEILALKFGKGPALVQQPEAEGLYAGQGGSHEAAIGDDREPPVNLSGAVERALAHAG